MNAFWSRDRRRFQRLKVNLDVTYKVESPWEIRNLLENRYVEATIVDVSETGAALLTEYNIPRWAKLILKFSLFKTDRNGMVSFSGPLEVVGEVHYSVPSEDNRYRLGIYFKEMQGEAREGISTFVASSSTQ